MDNGGYISIHRKILKWEWFSCHDTFRLFFCLLTMANHKDGKWQGKEIRRGQLITGRKALSAITGLSERKIRTSLKRLKSTNEVTIKPSNKYSIITITNYDSYQKNQLPKKENRPAIDQQSTTNNNVNNNNNKIIIDSVIDFLNEKTGKSFKKTTPSTRKKISARVQDGFSLEDFKTVISKKTQEWGSDPKMCDYLRPETLFGTKFESYLNQNIETRSFSEIVEESIIERHHGSWSFRK